MVIRDTLTFAHRLTPIFLTYLETCDRGNDTHFFTISSQIQKKTKDYNFAFINCNPFIFSKKDLKHMTLIFLQFFSLKLIRLISFKC